MRISDWSSDVCSSDLVHARVPRQHAGQPFGEGAADLVRQPDTDDRQDDSGAGDQLIARDRKSVVEGKSVSVRVDLGGRRIIKKKNIDHIREHYYGSPNTPERQRRETIELSNTS